MNEQIIIMEHRLTPKRALPASTLLTHMINHIDTHKIGQMEQLKHDIIHQSIITGRQMNESFMKTIGNKKQKYSFNSNDNNDTIVINAIERRRLHIIKRMEYVINYKLTNGFNINTT